MSIFKSLLQGNIVKHPAGAKIAQNWLNVMIPTSALISSLVPAMQPYLTEQNITTLFSLLCAVNVVFTTASTDKIGL